MGTPRGVISKQLEKSLFGRDDAQGRSLDRAFLDAELPATEVQVEGSRRQDQLDPRGEIADRLLLKEGLQGGGEPTGSQWMARRDRAEATDAPTRDCPDDRLEVASPARQLIDDRCRRRGEAPLGADAGALEVGPAGWA